MAFAGPSFSVSSNQGADVILARVVLTHVPWQLLPHQSVTTRGWCQQIQNGERARRHLPGPRMSLGHNPSTTAEEVFSYTEISPEVERGGAHTMMGCRTNSLELKLLLFVLSFWGYSVIVVNLVSETSNVLTIEWLGEPKNPFRKQHLYSR